MTPTSAADPSSPLLLARGLTKTFDRTRALAGADFELREREIHGLLGANGAGKSTLSKVISGHHMFDAGEMTYRGHSINLRSTRDALKVGIAIVMQETSLVPDLTVLENIFLPWLARPGRLDHAALRRQGLALLSSLGQADALPLDWEVRRLSSAQKQLVEIAKALGLHAKLLIFDEPTASLSPGEVDRLFDIMARLRLSGCGLVFVSHRLEEVFSITDRVTVLREGRTVMNARATASLNQAELIRTMVGAELGGIYTRKHPVAAHRTSPVVLDVRNLSAAPAVRDVSFSVRAGEILGLGGLVGAGRSETVEAVFGLRPRTGGTVHLSGKPLKPDRPQAAIRAGMGFVAEDRRTQNIVPDLSVKENLLLAHLGARRGFGLGYRSRERQVEALLKDLGLPQERLAEASMLNFSGGMQQKIIMARWLLLDPKVLVLDEPTKGVDIGTRAGIYAMLRDIAARGVAVVVVSSDFEELLGLSDRIVVISDGRSVADLPSALLDEEKLTLLAAPRTSMTRNTAMLQDLTRENGGAAFWALIEGEQLICLNAVVAEPRADPGFRPGEARALEDTRIARALRDREPVFVPEPDGERSTLMVPLRTARGHDLGWVGFSLQGRASPPPAAAIKFRIDTLAADPVTAKAPLPMSTTPLVGSAPKTSLAKVLTRRLEVRMVGLALLIAIVLSFLSPFFLTRSNIFNVLDQSVVIGIVSVGMTFVILTGGIDLSVGSVAGLTGIVLGLTLAHLPIPLAIAVAVLAGGGIGLVSGLLINVFGLASFVVTLGMMAIGRSLAYILSGQTAISDIPAGLQDIVYTDVLGIPSNILFLLLLYGAAWAYLTSTKGGRTIYAVGSNREAARAAGLSTLFYSVLPYVLSGACAAVAATFSIGQLLSADPLMGNAMELDAIAAVVIGGASLYGGRGSMVGTLMGVFITVMIRNGLNLMGVSPFWQGTAIGTIIIVALLFERLVSSRVNR